MSSSSNRLQVNVRRSHSSEYLTSEYRKDCRRAASKAYFEEFSRFFVPWMNKAREWYLARGEFPLTPMTLLPAFYQDPRDKETALIVAMLSKESTTAKAVQNVNELHEMIGEHPWKWFCDRCFMQYMQSGIDKNGGVRYDRMVRLLAKVWDACHLTTRYGPDGRATALLQSIPLMLDMRSDNGAKSYCQVMEEIFDGEMREQHSYYSRLAILLLCTDYGMGMGLIKGKENEVVCPSFGESMNFVNTFCPEYRMFGGFDGAAKLFGWTGADLYYSVLAWNAMGKRNARGCRLLAGRYLDWYQKEIFRTNKVWKLYLFDFTQA